MKSILFFLFSLLCVQSYSQSSCFKYYGGCDENYGFSSLLYHNQLYMGGYSTSFTWGLGDNYLIKTDTSGKAILGKLYRSDNSLDAIVGMDTAGNNELVAVCTIPSVFGYASLVRIDTAGNIVWAKSAGVDSSLVPDLRAVKSLRDKGFVLVGKVFDAKARGEFPYLVKYNSSGMIQWQAVYRVNDSTSLDAPTGIFRNVIELPDSSLVLSGLLSGNQFPQPFVLRTDKNGSILWSHIYKSTYPNEACGLTELSGGSFYCTWNIRDSPQNYVSQPYIQKMNTQGQVTWALKYQTSHEVIGMNSSGLMHLLGDSSLLLVHGLPDSSVYIIPLVVHIDKSGHLLWSKVFERFQPNYLSELTLTGDHSNNFYLGSSALRDGSANGVSGRFRPDIAVIRFDSLGNCSGPSAAYPLSLVPYQLDTLSKKVLITKPTITTQAIITYVTYNVKTTFDSADCAALGIHAQMQKRPMITLAPNPFVTVSTVHIESPEHPQEMEFEMIDVSGRLVMKVHTAAVSEFIIQRGNLDAGMYFYKLSSGNKLLGTGKVIVQG